MSKKETVKLYFLFIICLFFMGIGLALTKQRELGVSSFRIVTISDFSVYLGKRKS